jgi:hypothetical protein
VTQPLPDQGISVWSERAEAALEEALVAVRDGVDAIPAVTAALDCLRAEAGELSQEDVAALAEMFTPGPACTCPPELVARGGFRSSCPMHGGHDGP